MRRVLSWMLSMLRYMLCMRCSALCWAASGAGGGGADISPGPQTGGLRPVRDPRGE